MSDPYNYPFLKKDNTMYLSTICTYRNYIAKQDFKTADPYYR